MGGITLDAYFLKLSLSFSCLVHSHPHYSFNHYPLVSLHHHDLQPQCYSTIHHHLQQPAEQPGKLHPQHHHHSDSIPMEPVQHYHPGRHHHSCASSLGCGGWRVHLPGIPEPQAERPVLDHRAEGGQH